MAPSRQRYAVRLLLAGLIVLSGCATSRGELYSRVQAADAASTAESPTPSPVSPPPAEKPAKGVRIVTEPSGATVSVGYEVLGVTPLVLEDIKPGSYRILLSKKGYRDTSVWLEYDGSPLVLAATLEEITGFLQVRTEPPGATVLLAGNVVEPGAGRFRVGSYELRVRAFGYVEHVQLVEITEDALTSLSVTLPRAAFGFSWLDAGRTTLNPANYGNLGTSRVFFRVTAPGSGRLAITGPDGSEVFARDFPSFDRWDYEVVWSGRDAAGAPLPEGAYHAELTGRGSDGQSAAPLSLDLRIDRSAVIVFRPVFSGAAGLLYAPSPDTLPLGSTQFSLLAVGHVETAGEASFRIPVAAGLRVGLGVAEVDVEAGTYLSSSVQPGSVPLFASVSARYDYSRPRGSLGLEAAVAGRLAYHSLSTDTLTDYTGLALSAPVRLFATPVSILVAPELIVSYRRVSYGSTTENGFWVWGYVRAGLLVDLGPAMFGLSSALRLAPFSEGLALDLPLPVAAELHLTIPGTQVVLSAAAAAEVNGIGDYYILAGGGLGFLH